MDKAVENYKRVIRFNARLLTPARGEREADSDKGKADDHIPGADIRDWVGGLGDIEGHDPSEADKE